MVTKGYGFTVDDIDWSCPADLEPYAKAHKMEVMENDSIVHAICGSYVLSAVSVAVEHCLAGRKAKSEYIKEPVMSKLFENDGLTEKKITEKDIRKAILTEQRFMAMAINRRLPETIIK